MNCIKCQEKYYITEDTNSCYNTIIDNYYLDNDNILKRCHSNCLQCISAPINDTYMNCIKCQNNYYITEDTNSCHDKVIDNYYLDNDNKLKRCHSNCLQCKSAPINDTYMNCIKCQNNYYITEDTNSCYNTIIDNYYLDDDKVLKRCHSKCSKCYGPPNNDSMNCSECIHDKMNIYFYKKESRDCILSDNFKRRENIEFEKLDSINFYIFLVIFIISITAFILFCVCYKIENNTKKINNNYDRIDNNKIIEMIPINDPEENNLIDNN